MVHKFNYLKTQIIATSWKLATSCNLDVIGFIFKTFFELSVRFSVTGQINFFFLIVLKELRRNHLVTYFSQIYLINTYY